MTNLQNTIQSLLEKTVEDGNETGLQAAVYYKGELVADAFAGVLDPATGAAVKADSLFPAFSTTKGMMATIIHRLAERGALDYEKPIAHYWPEFAAGGKEGITLRQALGHSAGLPYVPLSVGPQDVYDWDAVCAAIAASEPAYPPGERVEYHALTYGWILGETASRATGVSVPLLWQREVTVPLGLKNELFCGLPAEAEPRVATVRDPNKTTPPEEPTPQQVPFWLSPLGEWINRPEARRACQPASNGIMSARAIARHYAALIPGGVDGVELLPPSRLQIATTPGIAQDTGAPSPYGLGYAVLGEPRQDALNAFGHGGHGGSTGQADPAAGWAFGFTKNDFNGFDSLSPVMMAIRDALPES